MTRLIQGTPTCKILPAQLLPNRLPKIRIRQLQTPEPSNRRLKTETNPMLRVHHVQMRIIRRLVNPVRITPF